MIVKIEENTRDSINFCYYLEQALDALYRDTNESGFWFNKENRIIKQINYHPLMPDYTVEFRYAPFGLLGSLYWKYRNPSKNQYNGKMLEYTKYIIESIQKDGSIKHVVSGFDYGIILSALSLADLIFFDNESYDRESSEKKIDSLYKFITTRYNPTTIKDNQDLFVLFGMCWYFESKRNRKYERIESIRSQIKNFSRWLVSIQGDNGCFLTGDKRATYHQRRMYPLWGLAKSIEITQSTNILRNIEISLDSILNRMGKDGGFFWHPFIWCYYDQHRKLRGISANPFKYYFFECHQTFFTISIEQYLLAGGVKDYSSYEKKAISWIYGTNRFNKNFFDDSPIKGVPLRMCNKNGISTIKNNMFKGSYEIGAYIIALTDLCQKWNQMSKKSKEIS
jgi:hypothetical protein